MRTVRVDIGDRMLRVPVMDLAGNRPGKTLLVTGGMDGDEYAGMEAAFRLAEAFSSRDFCGRLIVLPIVNIPGFENESSQNPLDQRYPKYIFPGRAQGTSTERLVHWLTQTYVSQADFWFDAHGGAITERICPFLWTYKTGVAEADAFMEKWQKRIGAETILCEKAGRGSKAGQLARKGCSYIIAESGERGFCREVDVERHLVWMKGTMHELGMTDGSRSDRNVRSKVLHHVLYYHAPFDGLWHVQDLSTTLKKGALIGACSKTDRSNEREVHAKKDGTVLWWKETLRMKRGDVLCAVGY